MEAGGSEVHGHPWLHSGLKPSLNESCTHVCNLLSFGIRVQNGNANSLISRLQASTTDLKVTELCNQWLVPRMTSLLSIVSVGSASQDSPT